MHAHLESFISVLLEYNLLILAANTLLGVQASNFIKWFTFTLIQAQRGVIPPANKHFF